MKKLLGLALIGCLGLSLTGCKADMGDVEKQAKLMEEIIEDGSIFEEDWEITMKETEDDYEGPDYEETMIITKDGDNFRIKMEDDEETEEIILIKKGFKYLAYNVTLKEYMELSMEELAYMEWPNMMSDLYESMLWELNEMDSICKEDGVTCEMKKNIFGKLTIRANYEGDGYVEVVVKKGKVLSSKFYEPYAGGVESETMEFDYGNQTVKEPSDKSSYKLVTE